MKKVPVEQLETEMIISKTVCTADGSVLLTPGTVVSQGHQKLLLDHGLAFVYIIEPETLPEEENLLSREITDTVQKIFRDLTLTDTVEQRAIKQTVNDLLRRVLKDRSAFYHLTEVKSFDSYIFSHSVNVCLLSVVIGMYLKLKGNQLKKLGLAALLHDVGRNLVPREILYKQTTLSEAEFEQVKMHTEHGYNILKSSGQYPGEVALTALQHHERMDGSGYPAGLEGEQISLFGRIVAVADVFDALMADRPFRKAFFPHQAVEIIVNSSNEFDPEVMRVFINNVAIYPMGSMVALNNGEIGVVVDTNKGQQTRPVLRVLFDPEARRLQSVKEVDLSKNSSLFITKIIKEEQMKKLISM